MARNMGSVPARRRSIRAALIAGAATALAACGIVLAITDRPPHTVPASETGARQSAAVQSSDDASAPAAFGTSASLSPSASPSPTPDLSWRDADFAVDPARPAGTEEATGPKTVFLTFDDGPSQNTERVLDILDRYEAKATFFVTGLMPGYAPWIRESYDRGHTIGLHTYSHDYAQVYSSTAAFYADLDAIGNLVAQQIGYVPAFIRFPGGSSNTISANYTSGIMTVLAEDVQARGYQYYDWTGSCGDGAVHPADVLVAEATKFADQENVVLLMHDSAAKDSTVEALPKVIEFYKANGYGFKALDRHSPAPHHGIGN